MARRPPWVEGESRFGVYPKARLGQSAAPECCAAEGGTRRQAMRAMVLTAYGGPEVLRLGELVPD